jgi:diaminohydroxyphosphoribosylaminopyrimidine deaminase/5-amino-6-(5-phosphoribosylamino)uracil reductase
MSRFLEEALELAARGMGRVSPNPAVGAVIVSGDTITGRGFHTWAGVKHAEVLAIEEAGERARGATLYVTLEPCSHQGRTRPCAEAIAAAGIRKVVAPMHDPNPQVVERASINCAPPASMSKSIPPTPRAPPRSTRPSFTSCRPAGPW